MANVRNTKMKPTKQQTKKENVPMNYKNDFISKFFQERGYQTKLTFSEGDEKSTALASVNVDIGNGATIIFRYLLDERRYETFFAYEFDQPISDAQQEAWYLRLGECCYAGESPDVFDRYMSFDRECNGDVYHESNLTQIVDIYQRGGEPIDVLCAIRGVLHAWDERTFQSEYDMAKADVAMAGDAFLVSCYTGDFVKELIARDTLGEAISDEWLAVKKPDMLGDDGRPVEGGLYDEDIFGPMSDWQDAQRRFVDVPSWVPDAGEIRGKMGVLELAVPVRAPFAPDDKCKWFHMSVLPVLPPVFRPIYVDGKGGAIVSYLADLYSRIALANGATQAAVATGDPTLIDMWSKRLQECVDALYNDYLAFVDVDEPGSYAVLERALMPLGLSDSVDEQMAILRTLQGKAVRAKSKDRAIPLAVALGRAAAFVGYQPAFTVGDAADFIDACYDCGEAIYKAFAADDSAAN